MTMFKPYVIWAKIEWHRRREEEALADWRRRTERTWWHERSELIARRVLTALRRGAPLAIPILLLTVSVYLVLALAQVGSGSSCRWMFPKWFGCVLAAHETLAAGLTGAVGALVAARIAWSAVQQQINAERERMLADRVEAEQLLADDMKDYAEGMAAAMRLL